MRNYEVNFIVDPVLSDDEIKSTADSYMEHLKKEGCEIVHLDEMGLRQLAYPINKRTSGVYYCIEFKSETGEIIPQLELAMQRDERIMRYLSVKLDKYGVKYNDDKRKGLIGSSSDKDKKNEQKNGQKKNGQKSKSKKEQKKASGSDKKAAGASSEEE